MRHPHQRTIFPPSINMANLRAEMARWLVDQHDFLRSAGISYSFGSDILREKYPPGELARFRLARAAEAYGFTGVVEEAEEVAAKQLA